MLDAGDTDTILPVFGSTAFMPPSSMMLLLEIAKWSAIFWMAPIRGSEKPPSHWDTAPRVTPAILASSSWVTPKCFLSRTMFSLIPISTSVFRRTNIFC